MGALSMSQVVKPGPGWYRGDFHLHTTASDGKYSPPELARLAKQAGLDFFAITDHNSIGSFTEFGDSAGPGSGLLVIPGIEITLVDGHWNVFGLEGWQDWMDEICTGRISIPLPQRYLGTTGLLERIAAQGYPNSINHPLLRPWEWCDGSADLRFVTFLEIWNDPFWPSNREANPMAVSFWTACLNAGYRITAIGGSDFHFFPGDDPVYPGERPGVPATWVYAEELSGSAVLKGLAQRRAYVSMGPQLEFHALCGGARFGIGDDLGEPGCKVVLEARATEAAEGCAVRITRRGRTLSSVTASGGRAELSTASRHTPACSEWYRLEVFAPDGSLQAITNPIFIGPPPQPAPAAFGDFVTQLFSV